MSAFEIGEVVVSTVTAQHLLAGVSYTVRCTRERRLPWGTFVEYGVTCNDRTVSPVDRETGYDRVLWVGNGHAVFRSAERMGRPGNDNAAVPS
jgi:hypothetical protein